MFTIELSNDLTKAESYNTLSKQLSALLSGERDLICNASQFSAFVMQALPNVNWAGFYFARGEELVLGPYAGKVACSRIPFTRGVCGAAARSLVTQRIEDVHAFPGHIACDSESASEIVIPIVVNGRLIGVFDIDSPEKGRFTEEDQLGLENWVNRFVEATDFDWQF
ncbi:GAF domain-containing protein [Marinomonas mediterranea]|jgi:GAF domain-containing protein|uniref:GAF domain-containing protein n=1 Tax=Marinomonas mediterranea (strain ATCC 700492 / JCM 21426 / NBRC 103028 / MMB-1) TaxID=717774 RepID=F2K106_MARM1|nr:GAF domain-containing protein [Marinomonas mediterranea]ADZ93355.1 GAF domain-containing protein [Marinomonas mediterranea MMB-1]WCN11245.1 GAF domain-containing protein [Marinomonas mediterranea]WCN15308.1 GAF domain-containing protein [Marinomonas mediterranea]WCN19352.1 GAF domain-containing protein [Marinomonas mediterranea MMB-1]